MIINIDEETTTQTDDWTRTASAPITFLEKKKPGEATDTGKEAPNETQAVDLTAAENSPAKKKTECRCTELGQVKQTIHHQEL
jgi:hypothetical protein